MELNFVRLTGHSLDEIIRTIPSFNKRASRHKFCKCIVTIKGHCVRYIENEKKDTCSTF